MPAAYTAATTKPTSMNAPTHMCANCNSTPELKHRPPRVDVGDPPVRGEPEAGRHVHPGVDRDDAEGPEHPGERHRHQAQQMQPVRQAPPAVQVDAEEDRLDEEGQSLERERQPEYVTELAHQPGP